MRTSLWLLITIVKLCCCLEYKFTDSKETVSYTLASPAPSKALANKCLMKYLVEFNETVKLSPVLQNPVIERNPCLFFWQYTCKKRLNWWMWSLALENRPLRWGTVLGVLLLMINATINFRRNLRLNDPRTQTIYGQRSITLKTEMAIWFGSLIPPPYLKTLLDTKVSRYTQEGQSWRA